MNEAKEQLEEAEKLLSELRKLTSKDHIALFSCQGGLDVPKRDTEAFDELGKLGLVVVSASWPPTGSVARVTMFRHYELTVAGHLLIGRLKPQKQTTEIERLRAALQHVWDDFYGHAYMHEQGCAARRLHPCDCGLTALKNHVRDALGKHWKGPVG